MTRNAQDIIDDMRNIVKPRIAEMLLEANFEGCGKEDKAEFETEFEMTLILAEKALEQQPCDDAISRQAALDAVGLSRILSKIKGRIADLPSVSIAKKVEIGHWSRKTKVDAYDLYGVKTWGIKCQCDRCTFTTTVVEDFGYYKYCPNCGARMEVEQDGD